MSRAQIKQMRKQDISAVFIENITDRRLLEQIARRLVPPSAVRSIQALS